MEDLIIRQIKAVSNERTTDGREIRYMFDGKTLEVIKANVDEMIKMFGGSSTLDITTDYDGCIEVTIDSKRPETDEEYDLRVNKDKHKAEYDKQRRLQQYLALKQEFEEG